ncbi:hypothetical protein H312_03413 [Anncaliia algerae PRA339]|uniref:Uncharacterized protein n=1 Tax=Anncaliia algerae PRA339 TaxID=1288291 RepID=A0A059EWE8_9MICR|nr:hypothetical protein H312_03413 [Anncaliia algerae PRA339]
MLLYLKCFNVSNVEIENQLGIKRNYIGKCFREILKNIDHISYECSLLKLGGPGMIIDVDETHIVLVGIIDEECLLVKDIGSLV